MKRISIDAYQAFREALATTTWYKRAFESLVKMLFRPEPELLAELDFGPSKRVIADQIVDILATREKRYQATTIRAMLELSAMKVFRDIEQLPEPDCSQRLAEAKSSVAALVGVTNAFSAAVAEQERVERESRDERERIQGLRQFADDVTELRVRFLALHSAANPQQRGRDFEVLLTDLFKIFELEPRLAYSLDFEQIDGSLSFNTDDYIVEAKWLAGPVDRAALDVFDQKVKRKGKNALGLFVAVNGFTSDARDQYSQRTTFLTIDGSDLFFVLDGRLRLDELLAAKRRNANETGSCWFPASLLISGG